MNFMRELVNFDDNYDVPAPAADDDARRRISRFYFWHRQNNPVEYVGVQTLNTGKRRANCLLVYSSYLSFPYWRYGFRAKENRLGHYFLERGVRGGLLSRGFNND